MRQISLTDYFCKGLGLSVAATFGYRVRDITPKPRRDASETVIWAE